MKKIRLVVILFLLIGNFPWTQMHHNAQGQVIKDFQEGPSLGPNVQQAAETGTKANTI